MADFANRCMQCMKKLDNGETVCSQCGFSVSAVQTGPYLPLGTVIKGRYISGKLIKRTIDSAVYIGFDNLNSKVIEIREFFPLPICERGEDKLTLTPKEEYRVVYEEYLQSFTQLWRNLMRFRGLPALFDVTDIVSCYATAYAVTDHNDGTTFRKVLENTDIANNPFTLKRVKELIVPMLSTVESLHTANIVHRGISPETLILTADGSLKIVGFAIPQVRTTKNDIMCSVYDGYSPIEQYGFNWQQGAWTDIYSIGALIYKLLTGRDLPPAPMRMNNGEIRFTDDEKRRIPESVRNLTVGCLALMPQERVKSIAEIRDVFVPFSAKTSSVTRIASPVTYSQPGVRVRTSERKIPETKRTAPEIVKPKQAIPQTKTAQPKAVTISESRKLEELEKAEKLRLEQEKRLREEDEKKRKEAEERRIRLQQEAEKQKQLKAQRKQEKLENSKLAAAEKKLKENISGANTQIKKRLRAEREKPRNPVVLGITTAVAVALAGVLTLMILYGTVLYKLFDAPVLDNALSSFAFLPVNSSRNDDNDVTYVRVPDFSNLTKEYIDSNTAYARKYNISYEYDYCDTVKKGYVFNQSVAPDENVPMGTAITVYISKGIEMITMVDVKKMTIEEATEKLTQLGFAVNTVEVYNNGFKRTGTVCEYSLEAGESYPKGTEVTVKYWGKPLATTEPTDNDATTGGNTTAQNEEPGSSYRWGLFSLLDRIFGN